MCCCENKCIVTIEVTTSGGSFALPTNKIIETRRITSVGIRKAASGQKSKSGKTLAAAAVIATAHLKLVDSSANFLAELPLGMLERDANSPEHLRVNWQDIGTSQSTVSLDTGASGYDAAHVIELIFGYDCTPQCN